MQRESSREVLSKKKWRSLTYNWEVLSTYGDSKKLYCLSDFQVAWLLSNTTYMGWSTRWTDCPCTPQDLANMKAELEYALMDCVDIQPYRLDYLYQQGVAGEIADLQARYDAGGIPDVNPNTPTDFYSGDGSDERLEALCTACYLYCYSYSSEWVSRAQTALGIAVVVGLASSVSIVGGVIASVLVGGLAFITQVALNAFNDTDALDDVVCCMSDALDGLAINQANFETSLNSCSFVVGSNQAIIRDIIASDLDKIGNWLSFIDALGDAFEFANNGVVLCPCSEPVTQDCWSWLVDGNGWGEGSSTCEFVAGGLRMRTNQQYAIGTLYFPVSSPDISADFTQITGFEVTWDSTNCQATNGNITANEVQYTYTDQTSDTFPMTTFSFPTNQAVQTIQYNLPPSDIAKSIEHVAIYYRSQQAGNTGTMYATNICLIGN